MDPGIAAGTSPRDAIGREVKRTRTETPRLRPWHRAEPVGIDIFLDQPNRGREVLMNVAVAHLRQAAGMSRSLEPRT